MIEEIKEIESKLQIKKDTEIPKYNDTKISKLTDFCLILTWQSFY
jgi:hypothetical protein